MDTVKMQGPKSYRNNQHVLRNGLPTFTPIIYSNPEEDSNEDDIAFCRMSGRQEGLSKTGHISPHRLQNVQNKERFHVAERPGSPARGHSPLYPQRSPLESSPYRYEPSSPVSGSAGAHQIPIQHLDSAAGRPRVFTQPHSPVSPHPCSPTQTSHITNQGVNIPVQQVGMMIPRGVSVQTVGAPLSHDKGHTQMYAAPVNCEDSHVMSSDGHSPAVALRSYSPKPASSVLVRGIRSPAPVVLQMRDCHNPVSITPQPATLMKTVLSQSMNATKRPGDLSLLSVKPKQNMMKEAEVDALTDLLIRNMEASGDPNFFGTCSKCGESIIGEDAGCSTLDQTYHVPCFLCTHCDKNLKDCPFFAVEGKPFCEDCYLATLEKCSVCSKVITERILRATGKPYHPQCFMCVVCGKSLDGIPFTVDATNQIHCIEDFHRKFAPRCHSCHDPIMPEANKDETIRIVAMDRSFHIACYKCEDCGMLLSSDAEGRGCYPLDDHILCKSCNAQRIQTMTSQIGSEL